MKLKNCLWAFALLFAVGCSSSDDGVQSAPDSPTEFPADVVFQKFAKDGEIKVMSFNVRLNSADDFTNAWPFRKDACIEMIKDQQPTVIGFQEAKYKDQWTVLKNALSENYDGWGVDRDNGEESPNNGETMGILYNKSKVKKLKGGTFWLSTTPDKVSKSWNSACNRTATWGIFEYISTGEKFCYINTHLDHKSAEAQKEGLKLIVEKFKEYNPDGYPQFLTGDFNIKIGNATLDILKGYMDDTRLVAPSDKTDSDRTYNNWSATGGSIIDYVYCTKGMQVVEYHTIDESYGVEYISDHYPIYAIIKL